MTTLGGGNGDRQKTQGELGANEVARLNTAAAATAPNDAQTNLELGEGARQTAHRNARPHGAQTKADGANNVVSIFDHTGPTGPVRKLLWAPLIQVKAMSPPPMRRRR
jgi:hypothetical protein